MQVRKPTIRTSRCFKWVARLAKDITRMSGTKAPCPGTQRAEVVVGSSTSQTCFIAAVRPSLGACYGMDCHAFHTSPMEMITFAL